MLDQQQSFWFKNAIFQSYQKGDFIYQQGENPKGLFYIKKGIVALKHVTNSGKEHLLRLYKCYSFFGHRSLITNDPYYSSALTLEDVQILFLPQSLALDEFEQNPLWYRDLTKILAADLTHCEQQRVMILENQILARTAQAIVYLKEFFPNRNWTRQEIAEFIASTSTTVIKALAELERRHLIQQKGRTIHILNREGLLTIPEDEIF